MADQYRIVARRRKVIELNAKGFSIPEIVQMLSRDHNIRASERTVWGDLHSEMALNGLTDFNAEQIRKFSEDLEKADLETKIRGRLGLIRVTTPRKQLIKEEVNQTTSLTINVQYAQMVRTVFVDDDSILRGIAQLPQARLIRKVSP